MVKVSLPLTGCLTVIPLYPLLLVTPDMTTRLTLPFSMLALRLWSGWRAASVLYPWLGR